MSLYMVMVILGIIIAGSLGLGLFIATGLGQLTGWI
jgi:hypothetical protein